MLKLKLKYFGYLIKREDSLEKTLMVGKTEGGRRRGWQRTRWLNGITNSVDMSLSKLQEWRRSGRPGVLQSMGSQRVRHDWVTEQQQHCLLNYIDVLFWLSFIFKNLNSSTPLCMVYAVGLDIKIMTKIKSGSQVWFVFSWLCYETHFYQNPCIKPPYMSSFSLNHKKRL